MLKSTAEKLWGDESGFIVSTDLILISSILVIGLLVGLVSLRDQIVQELGDVAVAVGNLNQSYSFAGHKRDVYARTLHVRVHRGGKQFHGCVGLLRERDAAKQIQTRLARNLLVSNVSIGATSEG